MEEKGSELTVRDQARFQQNTEDKERLCDVETASTLPPCILEISEAMWRRSQGGLEILGFAIRSSIRMRCRILVGKLNRRVVCVKFCKMGRP
ncbi:hypothetical protein X746_13010 [Mesorhizobium sp. LNJC380A00]|nr:hypothetical protein X746_13010 [Mesorhizobium sp. LNJC380A00]